MQRSRNGKTDQTLTPGAASLIEAPWHTPGYLMVIGGADRLDPETRLTGLFLQLVERVEANSSLRDIILISTATRHPEVLTGDYLRIFSRLGVPRDRIHTPLIDQSRAEEAIMAAYGQGAIIAGTSAGATAMGRPMIVAGGGTGELKFGIVQMSHGLAWAGDDLIIDTHFGARGRFPRLAAAVAQHPSALGVGIDENTCLLVDHAGQVTVAGAGVVYFLDASHVVANTAEDAHPGQPISVGPLRVDVLADGGCYDLRSRRVTLAAGEPSRV
jgi:cyanophycinase-like exopeptidase